MSAKTTGILLVNLGTPSHPTVKAVKNYLREFLSDRRVIAINPVIWQPLLNLVILPLRAKKSAKLYQRIWLKDKNKSPLLHYTEQQALLLTEKVSSELQVDFAMRYGRPSIAEKLASFKVNGIKTVKILPLYPQHSDTTTASVYDAVKNAVKKLNWQPRIIKIPAYYNDSRYIELLQNQVVQHFKTLEFVADSLLVSFHGIPQKNVNKGDPYYEQCLKTFGLLQKALKNKINCDIKLSFQSRFGPKKWLKPYTTEVLTGCAKAKQNVVVISPGFATDCLETLEELSVTERDLFLQKGGQNYSVIPCLNADSQHIDFLHELIG